VEAPIVHQFALCFSEFPRALIRDVRRMTSFSKTLEQSLHRALALANERKHSYATLEHLLLALVDDEDAATVLRAGRIWIC
jgi:hypothetical protein